jgi:hypothetical protein
MARHRGGGGLVHLLLALLLAAALLLAPAAAAEPEAEMPPTTPAQDAVQQQQQHLLPRRPLVIELPSEAAPELDGVGEGEGEGSGDEFPPEVRCASWRLAAEANNLAPWRAVPAECAAHVRDYVTGAAYRYDLELVARESAAYARAAAPLGDDGRDAWIFDVDETLLSNLPYYADHGYG